jgi:hypothetical protein
MGVRAPLTIAISVGVFIDSLYESLGVVEQTLQFISGIQARANAANGGAVEHFA